MLLLSASTGINTVLVIPHARSGKQQRSSWSQQQLGESATHLITPTDDSSQLVRPRDCSCRPCAYGANRGEGPFPGPTAVCAALICRLAPARPQVAGVPTIASIAAKGGQPFCLSGRNLTAKLLAVTMIPAKLPKLPKLPKRPWFLHAGHILGVRRTGQTTSLCPTACMLVCR